MASQQMSKPHVMESTDCPMINSHIFLLQVWVSPVPCVGCFLPFMQVKDNLLAYSQHKFASNVVEKCLQYGTKEERGVLIQHLLYGHSEG